MTEMLPFADWTRQWRAPMLRFARLHLQPDEDAEDAVQDALAALLATEPGAIVGDPRHYVFGILRHKLSDRLRQRYRHGPASASLDTDELDALLFDADGSWLMMTRPSQWPSPEEAMLSEQFFAVVDLCVQHLPARPARVFSLKELLGWSPQEIRGCLQLSEAAYWQCMSRARKQIQLCLDERWFAGERR